MYTNKFILLIIFQVFAISTFGQLSQQQLDSIVKKYTQNLQEKGIDTFCIYNEYCIGCLFQAVTGKNLCVENFSSLPTYIFWKDKGKTFVTKKDICFDYSVQLVSNDSIWHYYFANKDKIKKEKLKIPQYVEIVNGKKKIRSLNIDHSIYFRITLNTKNDSVTKDINSFYLTKELGINEEMNINYEYNTLTSLNNLHVIFQSIIKQESVKNKFVRTLR
jgi:hypothetical protein